MANKHKLIDFLRWIILVPIAILVSYLMMRSIEYLVSFTENYFFGADFYKHNWALFCTGVYGATFGYFLTSTAYHIAPIHKKKTALILLTICTLLILISNNNIGIKDFIIHLICIIIAGIITPMNLETENQNNIGYSFLLFLLLFIFVVVGVLMTILYVWTIKLAFFDYGLFGGIIAFFTPVLSQIFYIIKLWGINDGYIGLCWIVIGLNILRSIISKISF